MHHPWHILRDLPVTVDWRDDLPVDLEAATNGMDIIWMSKNLRLQVERRCTLTHEMVHIELEHDGYCNPKIERRVRKLTAERLIDTADLINAMKWARSVEELADELWVTVEVLMDRLHGLSTVERAMIQQTIRTAHGDD